MYFTGDGPFLFVCLSSLDMGIFAERSGIHERTWEGSVWKSPPYGS